MTSTTTHQSRWGHHPCDYELFLKLRALRRSYWRTVYDFHRWHRWQRKQPQNRVGPEPPFCPLFVSNEIWHKPTRRHGVDGCKIYPKTVTDHGLLALYQQARVPRAEAVIPFDDETKARIEALYAKASEYVVS